MLVRRKNSGFTIVELVVVIIILGILAATALPRFIGLEDEANSAVADGVRGAVVSGLNMTKAKWKASGGSVTADSALDTDGDGVTNSLINQYGWIVGSLGDDNALGGSDGNADTIDCDHVLSQLVEGGPTTLTIDTATAYDTSVGNSVKTAGTAGAWHGVGDGNDPILVCTMAYAPEGITAGNVYHYFTYTLASGAVSEVSTAAIP